MENLAKVRAWLAGKKTIITSVAGGLTALGGWATGALTGEQLVVAVYAALIAIFLRKGVAKKNGSP